MSSALKGWLPGDPVPADEPMMQNELGHFVPAVLVRPDHKLEDQLVRDLAAQAQALHDQIALFKACAFNDVRALLALLAERYKVKVGGARGGVVFHSYDGLMRVTISVADLMTFGPALVAAKALIDECITEWSAGANANIQAIVNDAFSVGDGGKLRVDRVLALRRLEIRDERWQRAMEAIGDALRVAQTREYIRVYRRANREAVFEQIVLDASRV
jgi:hypothetical protein